ncbi:phosphotransferase [Microbispora sp. NPDC004025]
MPDDRIQVSTLWELFLLLLCARRLASVAELGLIPDPDAVRALWEDAAAAPGWAGPALWLHGDLHPADILTADGTIRGVIDFGGPLRKRPGLRPRCRFRGRNALAGGQRGCPARSQPA